MCWHCATALRGLRIRMVAMRAFALFLALLLLPIGAFAQTNGPYGPILGLAQSYGNAALFGTGANGNLSCNSGATILAGPVVYNNLTITGTCTIQTNDFPIWVAGTLNISQAGTAAINSGTASFQAGPNAGGSNGGAPAACAQGGPSTTLPRSVNAAFGVNATTGAGAAGNAGSVTNGASAALGGIGVASGAGGSASNGGTAGGAGVAAQGGSTAPQFPVPTVVFANNNPNQAVPPSSWSGSSGGAGAGDGTNVGGGSGSGGCGGQSVVIYANTIYRGTNTNPGIIQAVGGLGGNGAAAGGGNAGGGGGGAGGSGGWVYVVAGQLTGSTIPNAIDVSGSAGGAGGNGVGTGKGGTGGNGGNSGQYQIVVLNPASFTASAVNQSGSTAATPSGTAGTAGAAGATLQGNL